MARIRGKNTKPELLIRQALHARGLRYRLHRRDLPGRPDLVFPSRRAAIQISGCFWHSHGCHLFRWPSDNEAFWREKINRNRERDLRAALALSAAGWRVMTVWECALRGRSRLDPSDLIDTIERWVRSGVGNMEVAGR